MRDDFVKDDSGNYAVFAEQRASASHMTAAKVLDVISRLLGCSGQASDAVSAYTHVERRTRILHPSEEDCRKIWIRLPKARRPHWDSNVDVVARWSAIFFGLPLAGL